MNRKLMTCFASSENRTDYHSVNRKGSGHEVQVPYCIFTSQVEQKEHPIPLEKEGKKGSLPRKSVE